jgi:hypothetical protein
MRAVVFMNRRHRFLALIWISTGVVVVTLSAVTQKPGASVGQAGVSSFELAAPAVGSGGLPETPSTPLSSLEQATPSNSVRQSGSFPSHPAPLAERFIYKQSAEDLIDYVTAVTNYTRQDLESFGHLHDFVKRLYKLAAVDQYGSKNHDVPLMGAIGFTDSPVWQMGEERYREGFSSEGANRIYAILPPIPADSGELFVRWTRVDVPGLVLFRKYRTAADVGRNHVWAEKAHGWQPGSYRVEVYSTDEFLDLLAVGDYVIH